MDSDQDWLLVAILVVLILFSGKGGDPQPGPTPTPHVDPAPFPSDGLSVLIVYESGDKGKYPPSQKEILDDGELRKQVTEAGGEIRLWDQDTDLTYVDDKWKKAMRKPRDSLPWILISHGEKGFSGPLPETVEKTEELIGGFK